MVVVSLNEELIRKMLTKFNMLKWFELLCFAGGSLLLDGCAGPGAHSGTSVAETRQLADGTQISFETRNGLPLPAENDWAAMKTGGLAMEQKNRDAEVIFKWRFALVFRTNGISSVMISDATGVPAKTWIQSTSEKGFQPKSKTWFFSSEKISPESPDLSWLSERATTEKFFKVVLQNSAGEERVLYQPVIYDGRAKQEVRGMANAFRDPRGIFFH